MTKYKGNSYPQHLLKSIQRTVQHTQTEGKEKSKKLFLTMPYKNDSQVREVQRSLKKCNLSDNLSVTFTSRKLLSYLKPKSDPTCKQNCKFCASKTHYQTCQTKNIVYKIVCNLCREFNIGETSRTIQSRLKEHCKMRSSQVYQHFIACHTNTKSRTLQQGRPAQKSSTHADQTGGRDQ